MMAKDKNHRPNLGANLGSLNIPPTGAEHRRSSGTRGLGFISFSTNISPPAGGRHA